MSLAISGLSVVSSYESLPGKLGEFYGQAVQIIREIALEKGKPDPMSRKNSGYGSAWFVEFPQYLTIVVAQEGEDAARWYARHIFTAGTRGMCLDHRHEWPEFEANYDESGNPRVNV